MGKTVFAVSSDCGLSGSFRPFQETNMDLDLNLCQGGVSAVGQGVGP